MKYLFDKDHQQQITEVTFAGKTYGITFIPYEPDPDTDYDGEIGVFTPGNRRIKYMRVKWDCDTFAMFKSYIRSNRTVKGLYTYITTCAKHQMHTQECVAFCEHVLTYGRGKR